MIEKYYKDILKGVPTYNRFLTLREIDELSDSLESQCSVKRRTIGRTIDEEDLDMFEIGKGKKTALIIGVPHSDEPLGSLVTTYFLRWLATHPEAEDLGWKWLVIPVLERKGMSLNEGWYNTGGNLAAMAKSYFREPTEDQYEWTFPIQYKDYEWKKSRPETLAVKKVLEDETPNLLCGLHHCGFNNAYYYFSEELPPAYPRLRKLASNLRIPLSDSSPDVPFEKMFTPGFYSIYGFKDYYDYYSKNQPEMLKTMKRGACSDEWYLDEIGGFSFNCEVPMHQSPYINDKKPSKMKLKNVIESSIQKEQASVKFATKLLNRLKPNFELADPILLDAAKKHIENANSSINYATTTVKDIEDRLATKSEVFEKNVLADLMNLILLGQIWRVAESICIKGGAPGACNMTESLNLDIGGLARVIQEEGAFFHMPIQKLVKMQLGSILIISDVLMKESAIPE